MFRRAHLSVKTVAPATPSRFTSLGASGAVSTVCAALSHSQSSSMNSSALSATATRFLQRLSSRASLAAAHASWGVFGLVVCMPLVLPPGEVFGEVFGSDF